MAITATDLQHPALEFFTRRGLNLQAVLALDTLPAPLRASLQQVVPGFATRYRQALLLGHGGRRLWEQMARRGADPAASRDPVDAYSAACVSEYFATGQAGVAYQCLYPGPAPLNLPAWGELAGWHHASPLRVGINAVWGTWFAYRALVLAATDLPLSVPLLSASPCVTCADQPCIRHCPAAALVSGTLQLDTCVSWRRQPASACSDRCLARLACPVASAQRYSDAQVRYHYGVSMDFIRQYDAGREASSLNQPD